MTLRTGKGGRYRYYTCSIKARQGETGCKGRSIPMEKLDNLVASHIEERLLQPERLEEVLASVLDRRQDRADRRRQQIAELNQRAAETDLRLKRLYDAIESGVADLGDPALKDRIAGLKAIRDQARTDAERAQATLESSGNQSITPDMVRKFASAARERMRVAGGGYRRDHLRALAQRVEVAEREVRIMGSKGDLLRTLTAASGVKSATPGVRSSVPKWRPVGDSNPCRRRERAVSWASRRTGRGSRALGHACDSFNPPRHLFCQRLARRRIPAVSAGRRAEFHALPVTRPFAAPGKWPAASLTGFHG